MDKYFWKRLIKWNRSPIYRYFKIKKLIRQLNNENPDVRMKAAEALGDIKDASVVPVLIKALKDKDEDVRGQAADAFRFVSGASSAVPVLIEALKDESEGVRRYVAFSVEIVIGKCKTIGELREVEERIAKGSVALRKGRVDKDVLIKTQIEIAKLTRKIAKRKDELAPKRDLLLEDKPKPPKKGRGVYQVSRRIRN